MSNKSKKVNSKTQQTALTKPFIESILKSDSASSNDDLFSLVIEHLPDQIYLKDSLGHFIMCNTPVALNAGCATPGEMIGKTDFDFYPPDDAKTYYEDEHEIMTSSKPLINHEEHFTDKHTKEIKWNLTTKVPIKNEADKVIGLLGINRDITNIKNALLEREKTMQDLLQRNKDLEHFTYIVSHNLRVPVANILGLLEIVTHLSTIDPEDLKTVFKGITKSAKKLDAIIHNLNSILEPGDSLGDLG
ncbi:MAG: PAS domain-containing protein [Bacteroidota bacterium]